MSTQPTKTKAEISRLRDVIEWTSYYDPDPIWHLLLIVLAEQDKRTSREQ